MIPLEEKVGVLDWAVGLGTTTDMASFNYPDPESQIKSHVWVSHDNVK